MTVDESNSRARHLMAMIVRDMTHLGFIARDADTQALAEVGVLKISSAIQAAYEAGAKVHASSDAKGQRKAKA